MCSVTVDLPGLVVLVTGASGGLGPGLVRGFAETGATVVEHRHAHADLTDESQRQGLVERVLAEHGRLDVLVNNAAIQPVSLLAELSLAELQAVIDTNLTAAIRLSQLAAEAMRERGGSIISIASIEGSRPAVGHGHYASAKAGLIMHARAAALEYGRYGIRVNTVSPGLIDAGSLAEAWPEGRDRWLSTVPLRRTATPADVAAACVFLASPAASFITGVDLLVDGGMSAVPGW